MHAAGTFGVCYLHERPDLLTETGELINTEWPRSLAARLASIEGSSGALPCSLVLTSQGEAGRVVGHARIMAVAGRGDAALVETVVVAAHLRGRGLGRLLMEAAEKHACKVGCSVVHLSTHDQLGFYTHLGYSSGPVVSPLRKCVAQLTTDQTESLLEGLAGSATQGPCSDHTAPNEPHPLLPSPEAHPLLPSPEAPPPPAPPPPPPKVLECPVVTVTWMKKDLA